ncbi:MAG: single-stranded DNA-binding protein, partial [Planococcaceae bacterium]|nr:single-stranded DNA-binding protein [Planococcaceae bacterium]
GDRPQQGQPYGGGSNQNNQYSSNQQNQSPNQQNYTRVDEDPFSSGSGPIEVSDDDLPF